MLFGVGHVAVACIVGAFALAVFLVIVTSVSVISGVAISVAVITAIPGVTIPVTIIAVIPASGIVFVVSVAVAGVVF